MHRWAHHARAGVRGCMRGLLPWLRPMSRGGRGPHAPRGAWQVHRPHEGAGAPRVARPVQALGVPVRPAPAAAAAVRVRDGAGAALRRVALPRRGAGLAPRGVGCGGGGVAGRRPTVEPRARMAGARGPTGARSGEGRSRPARPHGWRAGKRLTPSSRRCRRRPTGRASRHCECPPPPRSHGPAECARVAGVRAH